MKKVKIIIFAICYLLSAICSAQQSITWQRTYNGPYNDADAGDDVCLSDNGNFIIAGTTRNGPNGWGYFIKINQLGDTLWSKIYTYGGRAIVSTWDGGCVFTAGDWIGKLNSNGDSVWLKFYSSQGSMFDLKKTNDGGYVASGGQPYSGSGYILKVDSLGELQWQRTYPSGEFKTFYSIEELYNEGYVVAGIVSESISDTPKAIIMKTDTAGNLLWEKRYKVNNENTTAKSLNKINGGYLIGGSIQKNIRKNYFLKTDTDGDSIYTKVFPTQEHESFGDMKVINNNRYVIGMLSDTLNGWIGRGKVIITDSVGTIIYNKILPTQSYILIESIRLIPNGDIIFVGTAEFNSQSGEDIYALRTDSMLNAPPPIGIIMKYGNISREHKLYQNYPNPFNSKTNIKFDVNRNSKVRLVIYDILGQEITSLIDNELMTGSYIIEWNADKFSSGVYLFRLLINGQTRFSNKMVLIK